MDGAFPSQKGQPFDNGAGGYGRGGSASSADLARRGFRGTAENAKTKLCTRLVSRRSLMGLTRKDLVQLFYV
jgi:hypothetical protein